MLLAAANRVQGSNEILCCLHSNASLNFFWIRYLDTTEKFQRNTPAKSNGLIILWRRGGYRKTTFSDTTTRCYLLDIVALTANTRSVLAATAPPMFINNEVVIINCVQGEYGNIWKPWRAPLIVINTICYRSIDENETEKFSIFI